MDKVQLNFNLSSHITCRPYEICVFYGSFAGAFYVFYGKLQEPDSRTREGGA